MSSTLTFILFTISVMVAPGPNNLMIMHSGLNFGIRKTINHAIGSLIGGSVLVAIIGLGLGFFMHEYPISKTIIKILGSCYMLFLAVKISQMNENKNKPFVKCPLSIMQALLFQLVNPKLWIIIMTLSGIFHESDNIIINTLLLMLSMLIITTPCLAIWMSLGRFVQKIIKNYRHRKIFNLCLGFFLAITVLMLWI